MPPGAPAPAPSPGPAPAPDPDNLLDAALLIRLVIDTNRLLIEG